MTVTETITNVVIKRLDDNVLIDKFRVHNYATSNTDEKVKYDVNDPTGGYIADKFVAGTNISLAEGTGANENKLVITNSQDISGKENVGVASGLVTTHESTYNHSNYNTAYSHSQVTTGNPHSVTKTDVGLSNVDNTSDANKPVSTAQQTALNAKLNLDQTTSQTVLNGQPIQDTLTASELVATDASKKLQSLAVATYPSLTEISYVKGLTSSAQTQISNLVHASFYAGTMTVNTGTLQAGTVTDLQAVGGTDVDILESTGADPLRVTFDFTGVTRLSSFAFYGNYNGGGTHQISIEVYNVGTTDWDVLGIIGIDTVKAWYSFPIFNTSAYLNAGAISVRLRHVQNGVNTHHLYLDYLEVNYGGAGGQSNIAASAITNTPSGNISATNVESALNELDTEKEPNLTGAVVKNTIHDNDKFIQLNSESSDATSYNLWSVIKSTLKTYFDGLYNTILTFGIANTNSLRVDDASVADNDYAKFTANGLEGQSYSEVKTDLSLNNVDNTSDATLIASIKDGGSAEIDLDEFGSGDATSGQVPTADGSGGVAWGDQSGSGASLWTAVTGTRASNTTFTVASDVTAIFKKGMIVMWTDTTAHLGMVSIPSTESGGTTTITIIGDVCTASASDFKYCLLGAEMFMKNFAVAGTIGAVLDDVCNAFYATEPYRVLGADLQVGTAGTTNSTTIDIDKATTTMFTTKPTLGSTVASSLTPFTADDNTSLALGDRVRINIDAIQSVAAVDLYVQLYIFPTRYLSLT